MFFNLLNEFVQNGNILIKVFKKRGSRELNRSCQLNAAEKELLNFLKERKKKGFEY